MAILRIQTQFTYTAHGHPMMRPPHRWMLWYPISHRQYGRPKQISYMLLPLISDTNKGSDYLKTLLRKMLWFSEPQLLFLSTFHKFCWRLHFTHDLFTTNISSLILICTHWIILVLLIALFSNYPVLLI